MSESERDIEKLLKACAKMRRDEAGAPLEMHPATRRLLQGEVARRRTAQTSQEGNFLSKMFAGLWPRFALGACIFAILAVGTWAFLHSQRKEQSIQLAKAISNEPAEAAKPLAPPAATPDPAPAAPEPADLNGQRDGATVTANGAVLARTEGKAGADRFGDLSLDFEKSRQKEESDKKSVNKDTDHDALQVGTASTETEAKKIGVLSGKVEQPPLLAESESLTKSYGVVRSATTSSRRLGTTDFKSESGKTDSTQNAPMETALADRSGDKESFGKVKLALKPSTAPSAPALGSVIADDSKANLYFFDTAATRAVSPAKRFAQLPSQPQSRLASKPSDAQNVLAAFQVQQTGHELQIIDSDGSTYSGYVQAVEAMARKRLAFAESAGKVSPLAKAPPATRTPVAPGASVAAAREQSYSFRVEGTNRSLNQKVVFNGNLLVGTNASPISVTNVITLGAGEAPAASSAPLSVPLENSRISGKALIGNREIEVNAAPVSP